MAVPLILVAAVSYCGFITLVGGRARLLYVTILAPLLVEFYVGGYAVSVGTLGDWIGLVMILFWMVAALLRLRPLFDEIHSNVSGLAVWGILLVAIGGVFPDIVRLFDPSAPHGELVGRMVVDLGVPGVALIATAVLTRPQLYDVLVNAGGAVMIASLVLLWFEYEGAVIGSAGRLRGMTPGANLLGFVVLMLGVLIVASGRWSWRRLALVVLAVFTAVETGQRSSYAILIIVLAVALCNRLLAGVPSIVRWIGLFAAMVGSSTFLITVGFDLIDSRRDSAESRVEIWSFLLSRSELWWPFGIGNRGIWDLNVMDFSLSERFFHAHNQVLTWVVAGGVLAGIGCVFLALALARTFAVSDIGVLFSLIAVAMVESPLVTGGRGLLLPVALYGVLVLLSLSYRPMVNLRGWS